MTDVVQIIIRWKNKIEFSRYIVSLSGQFSPFDRKDYPNLDIAQIAEMLKIDYSIKSYDCYL
jgi:hypothetical protein